MGLRTRAPCIIFDSALTVTHEFSIPAHDLDAGGKRFRFALRAAWIRGALEGTDVRQVGPGGELDLRLSKSGTDVVVRGTLTAEVSVACARCLEPARVVVTEPISALVVPAGQLVKGPHAEVDEEQFSGGEADLIPYDGETVVLDQLVRDELLLGIPMIPLCSESCPGIRAQTPSESASAGIDPRLRPLLQIKKSPT
jgi:DUF177 domain-containing protein